MAAFLGALLVVSHVFWSLRRPAIRRSGDPAIRRSGDPAAPAIR
jgi:hypothetical protein